MTRDESFKVGYVLRPHGLKGEVTAVLENIAEDDLPETVYLDMRNALIPFFIEKISFAGNKVFIKFEDTDTPEAAAAISRCEIFLPKSARPKSGRGEFYDDEVVGFAVTDENHGVLGRVQEVVEAGPNRLLQVARTAGGELLIPVNGPFIKGINKSKRTISVSLPDGFLDI